jgi:hypothetical protein
MKMFGTKVNIKVFNKRSRTNSIIYTIYTNSTLVQVTQDVHLETHFSRCYAKYDSKNQDIDVLTIGTWELWIENRGIPMKPGPVVTPLFTSV